MKTNEEIIKDEELEILEGGVLSEMEQASSGVQGVNRCCNGNLQEVQDSANQN